MKKTIFVLCACLSLFGLEAKNNTYQVDDRGGVTVGASKPPSKSLNINDREFNRKPERSEIIDHDPRSCNKFLNK